MEPKYVYKFCPKCSGNLFPKKDNLLVCSKCGYEFYINAVPCNAAIIENKKGEILLVKRKFPPQKGYWDWPGGFLDGGESLEHSVRREIKEELGVEVSVGKIVGAYEGTYEFQKIIYPILCIAVSAKITGGEIKVSDDVDGYKYFPLKEIQKMDLSFEIIRQGISDYFNPPKQTR